MAKRVPADALLYLASYRYTVFATVIRHQLDSRWLPTGRRTGEASPGIGARIRRRSPTDFQTQSRQLGDKRNDAATVDDRPKKSNPHFALFPHVAVGVGASGREERFACGEC